MTIRQKRRAKLIGKNSTTEAELLAAGYSPSTARHQPPTVTKAKGWVELMDKYLPDDKVLVAHQAGLEATKVVSAIVLGKDANSKTTDFIDVPDHPTRLKAVELAYKVKRKIGNDGSGVAVQVNFNHHAEGELKEFE